MRIRGEKIRTEINSLNLVISLDCMFYFSQALYYKKLLPVAMLALSQLNQVFYLVILSTLYVAIIHY